MPTELEDVYAAYMQAAEQAAATQAELDATIQRMHQLKEQLKNEQCHVEILQRKWIMNI